MSSPDRASAVRRLERLERAAAGAGAPEATLRSLDDVVAERRVRPRDCRSCKNYRQDESGLGFGWCIAHEQYVKLFHPAGEWFSQCLFKSLRRFKPHELEPALTSVGREGDASPRDGAVSPEVER